MKDWTGNHKSTFSTLGASNHSDHERETHDYYATEPRAIDKLFGTIGNQLSDLIWEPACGEGHLSKRMKELNPDLTILNSDIINRGFLCEIINFRDYYPPNSFDGDIITNPPYKYAQEFVHNAIQAIQTGHLACFFLKLTFLEGQKRKLFFKNYPPKYVIVSSDRLQCAINGNFHLYPQSAAAYAWFVWQKGCKEPPIIQWC